METQVRQLPFQLTPEDIDTRARLLARKLADRNEKEAEKSAAAKRAGEEIKALDLEIDKLTDAVNTGKERRPIPVSEQSDNRRFCVETIRHDTMAVIETRAMTTDEVAKATQPTLFDERSTAQSRDDMPPTDASTEGEPAQLAAPSSIEGHKIEHTGDECEECHELNDVHKDDCSKIRPAATEPPADAAITDPGGLLSGKPDGTA
jgi:hypothetical protein